MPQSSLEASHSARNGLAAPGAGADAPSAAEQPLPPRAPHVERYAAVGAGRMGRGIAIALALAGERISLIDLRRRDADAWPRLQAEVRGEIDASLRGLVEIGALAEDLVAPVVARIGLVDAEAAPEALAGAVPACGDSSTTGIR
jgi:hypothetical protein